MDGVVLDNIAFDVDVELLAKKLRIKDGSRHREMLGGLVEQARPIARPKALYRPAYVEDRGEDWVVVAGVRLASRVLRVNLEKAHRVFAYVATGGVELDAWASSFDDMLSRFCADAIAEMGLRCATRTLAEHLAERYRLGQVSHMSPGSLEDWPIDQQRPLFQILGDTRAAVGVRLTESCVMVPVKSVSGIRFPTEESFESCQLCPREDCPGRRAPYDAGLYERKYLATS